MAAAKWELSFCITMKLCPVSEIFTLELLITIWLYQVNVGNCKSLGKEHVPLVEKLVETGKEILQKNNVTDLSDVRFGFHWPPFCSVTHLHLHVLAPVSQMGFMSRLVYRLNSYWFITADQLVQRLNSMS
ncbi:hypothetical protein QQF64_010413 [Cirrhinus molitorella]|uniref:Histidine triad nucleotide binding protein 3 n=1 Tax=Cirrhinus molitorella TaxID=172907 RepID=A0ABR3M3Y7_9TELE